LKRKNSNLEVSRGLRITQKRGQKTYDTLIKTAFRLLKNRVLSSISIAELTRAAGYSVGAFYARFKSKDEFLDALVDYHLKSRRVSHATLFSTYSGEELIDKLIADLVTYILKHRGFWQSCLMCSVHDPNFWEPMRELGYEASNDIIGCMSKDLGRELTEQEKLNVRFGFQITFGTINNTIINHPGPIEIKESLFIEKLTCAFKLVSGYYFLRNNREETQPSKTGLQDRSAIAVN